MAVKPPIGLSAVLRAPNGAESLWDAHAPDPERRPSGMAWRTERGSGFMDGSCVLPRDVRGDYLDLRLLNEGRFVGADGSIAYEGILNIAPRSVDTGGHSITPTFIGPIALAQDTPFSEVYVDRAFASWGDMPLNRKVALTVANSFDIATLSWATEGALFAALPNQAVGGTANSEIWYEAPSGVNVETVAYVGTDTAMPAGWLTPTLYDAPADDGTGGGTSAATFDGLVRVITLTTPRPFVFWRVYALGTAATPAAGANRRISQIAVYGTSGLSRRSNGSDLAGLWLSDILTDIANRFVPQLDTSGVRENTTLIEQCRYESMLPTMRGSI
jgi:hypothetical protein